MHSHRNHISFFISSLSKENLGDDNQDFWWDYQDLQNERFSSSSKNNELEARLKSKDEKITKVSKQQLRALLWTSSDFCGFCTNARFKWVEITNPTENLFLNGFAISPYFNRAFVQKQRSSWTISQPIESIRQIVDLNSGHWPIRLEIEFSTITITNF